MLQLGLAALQHNLSERLGRANFYVVTILLCRVVFTSINAESKC